MSKVTCDLREITRMSEERPFDLIVIGSGPAAAAVVDYCYDNEDLDEKSVKKKWRILILERGDLVISTHVSNINPQDPRFRGNFITAHEAKNIWDGDFYERGMMMYLVGGRGAVAGALLPRFYDVDWSIAWPDHAWPLNRDQFIKYYVRAEVKRNVQAGEYHGTAQGEVQGRLSRYNAMAPPWGGSSLDNSAGRIAYYTSPLDILYRTLLTDYQDTKVQRRLYLATNAYAVKLEGAPQGSAPQTIEAIVCKDNSNPGSQEEFRVRGSRIVLAAGTIESARLMLNSGYKASDAFPVGRYLAEHIYERWQLSFSSAHRHVPSDGINVLLPPHDWDRGRDNIDRYQIDLRGNVELNGKGIKGGMTGSAAMDPNPSNTVTLSSKTDLWGVPKACITLNWSEQDERRRGEMIARMSEVKRALNATDVQDRLQADRAGGVVGKDNAKGRSHHEAGTLRMGRYRGEAVVNLNGKVFDTQNLYVADASVFRTVGVANPMLTISAWAYHVAEEMQ